MNVDVKIQCSQHVQFRMNIYECSVFVALSSIERERKSLLLSSLRFRRVHRGDLGDLVQRTLGRLVCNKWLCRERLKWAELLLLASINFSAWEILKIPFNNTGGRTCAKWIMGTSKNGRGLKWAERRGGQRSKIKVQWSDTAIPLPHPVDIRWAGSSPRGSPWTWLFAPPPSRPAPFYPSEREVVWCGDQRSTIKSRGERSKINAPSSSQR